MKKKAGTNNLYESVLATCRLIEGSVNRKLTAGHYTYVYEQCLDFAFHITATQLLVGERSMANCLPRL